MGGERAKVVQVLRPNTDPHDYEPRPRDVRETADADVVAPQRRQLDRWMGDVVEAAGGDPAIVDLGARVPVKVAGESEGPEASRYDPHWWHDPRNAQAAVARDPRRADEGQPRRPRRLRAQRRRLPGPAARARPRDRRLHGPRRRPRARKLVTDHDAFDYFARRYAITVVGAVIPSQSTQAQPSAGDVARLTRLIRARGRQGGLPRELDQRQARAGHRAPDRGDERAQLYGDTLGPKGSSGATYLTMERANADAMVRGFTAGAQGCPIAGI